MGFFARLGSLLFDRKPAPPLRVPSPKDRRRWPDWISSGLTLDRLGAIFRNADQGDLTDLMSLLQEVAARDPLLTGLLSVRLSAISQRKVKVVPNESDPDQQRAAEVARYVQGVLDNLKIARSEGDRIIYERGLSAIVESLVLASYYGVSAAYVYWGLKPNQATPQPTALEFFDERRFWLDIATDELYISTERSGDKGCKLSSLDPATYLELRYNRISKRLPMSGAGRSILLSWWIRFGSVKDLTNYLETWSKPGLVISASGDSGPGYNEDQYEELQQFLEDYMGDTRVLLPPGFTVQLLEASQGGEKAFQLADSLTERHMQFAIVGQVGSIAGDATTYASASQANRVRDDLTDGDCRFVAESLGKIGRDAVQVRYGVEVPAPLIEFEVEKSIEAIKDRALAIQAASYPLVSMLKGGVPIDVKKYAEIMDLPINADGAVDPQWLANIKRLAALGLEGGADQPDPSQQSRIDTWLHREKTT